MIRMRIAQLLIGIAAFGAVLGGTAAGLPAAHAGGSARIAVAQLSHDVSHCERHGNVESCYTTTVDHIRVTGTGFTPGGPIEVQILDAQTLAVLSAHTFETGDHGGFGLDTLQDYCAPSGRVVFALDLTDHSTSNSVHIHPCASL